MHRSDTSTRPKTVASGDERDPLRREEKAVLVRHHKPTLSIGKEEKMEFEESIVVCIAITVLFLIGLGVCNLIGLGFMKIRDREWHSYILPRQRTDKKRLYAVVRRIL